MCRTACHSALAFPALSAYSLLASPLTGAVGGIKEEFNCSLSAGGSCVTPVQTQCLHSHPLHKIPSTTGSASCTRSVTAGLHASTSNSKVCFFLDPIRVLFLQNNPRNVSLQSSQTLLAFSVYMCCPLSSAGLPA